ncbi:farnesol dehydrogenase-like [Athalia rosae]|uniref:farnesol dehydrogenase-like n=1 Tax=Athalia rosae TaxID=37344 RepID=UPI0020341DD5|nr:farnesol dehydrogenase-like [Athalia rosae]
MERWSGKVAIVTGASSGIGAATTEALVREGLHVVGVARRVEKVAKISEKLKGAKGKLYAKKCDLAKEKDILEVFEWVKKNLGGVDVLVNNAAVVKAEPLSEGSTEGFRSIMDVNVIGVAIATREAVRSMKERKSDGHIININSVVGHSIEMATNIFSLYPSSKYAVTAMTEVIRKELALSKSKIKITSLSPGLVNTEMIDSASNSDESGLNQNFLRSQPILNPEDIANGIVYVLSTPPHVQVSELTIRPVGELIENLKSD